MNPQTDKATARPWKSETEAWKVSPWVGNGITDNDGRPIALVNNQDAETNSANRALIVQAVNEYAALNAVAEIAGRLTASIECGETVSVEIGGINLSQALSTLAALRGGK